MTEFVQYLPLLLGIVVGGVCAGVLAGFLGVGGGIILVPVLSVVFDLVGFPDHLSIHMAVATSLATIVFTSISSVRAHHKRGAVDFDVLKSWGITMALGALAGGLALRFIDPAGLKLIFGLIAILVAVNLSMRRPLKLADQLPQSPLAKSGLGGAIGLISSLMGIGGGTLGVPILTGYAQPIARAVGTAAGFGLIIAVPAVIGFVISGAGIPDRPPLSLGYISLPTVLIVIPFTMALAPVGAKLAHTVDPKWVKRGFSVFLALTAVRMLSGVLG